MTADLPILVRPATLDDVAFVAASFTRSMSDSEHGGYARRCGVTRDELKDRLRDRLVALLPSYSLDVACDPVAPDVIYGWIAHRNATDALFCYVRKDARRNHVASRLLTHAGFVRYRPFQAAFVRLANARHLRSAGWNIIHSPLLTL